MGQLSHRIMIGFIPSLHFMKCLTLKRSLCLELGKATIGPFIRKRNFCRTLMEFLDCLQQIIYKGPFFSPSHMVVFRKKSIQYLPRVCFHREMDIIKVCWPIQMNYWGQKMDLSWQSLRDFNSFSKRHLHKTFVCFILLIQLYSSNCEWKRHNMRVAPLL